MVAAGEDTAFAPLIPDLLHLLEGQGQFQVSVTSCPLAVPTASQLSLTNTAQCYSCGFMCYMCVPT